MHAWHYFCPPNGFATLEDAQKWSSNFVTYYNTEHQHSALNFVTPQQKHQGDDIQLLGNRKMLLERHRQKHPERWINVSDAYSSPLTGLGSEVFTL